MRAVPPTTMLGVAIRELRNRKTLGQPEAAEQIGISRAALSGVERGSMPSLETARALAKWLGWTVEQVAVAAETPAGEG